MNISLNRAYVSFVPTSYLDIQVQGSVAYLETKDEILFAELSCTTRMMLSVLGQLKASYPYPPSSMDPQGSILSKCPGAVSLFLDL